MREIQTDQVELAKEMESLSPAELKDLRNEAWQACADQVKIGRKAVVRKKRKAKARSRRRAMRWVKQLANAGHNVQKLAKQGRLRELSLKTGHKRLARTPHLDKLQYTQLNDSSKTRKGGTSTRDNKAQATHPKPKGS